MSTFLSPRTVRRLGVAAVGVTGVCLAGYAYRPRLRVTRDEGPPSTFPSALGAAGHAAARVGAATLSGWAGGSSGEAAVLAALTDLCSSADGCAALLAGGGIDALTRIVERGEEPGASRALGLLARASTDRDGRGGGPRFAALCAVLPPRTWASLSAAREEPCSALFFAALETALDAGENWAPAHVTLDLALTLALRPDPAARSDALRRVGARVLARSAGERGGEHARRWERVAEEHTRSLARRAQKVALDSGAETSRAQWLPSAVDSARLLAAMGVGGARTVIVAAAAAALGQGGAGWAPLPAVSALCDAAARLAPVEARAGGRERHLLGLLLARGALEGEAGAAMLSWLRLTAAEESGHLEPSMHSLPVPLTGGMPVAGDLALSLLHHAGVELQGQAAERAERVRHFVAGSNPGAAVHTPPVTALPEPEALPSGGLTDEEASVALARPRTLRLHALTAYMPLLSRVDSASARLGLPLFTEFAPPAAPALHAHVLPSRADILLSLTRCSDERLVEEAAQQLRAMLSQGGTTPLASLLAQRWLLSCVASVIPHEDGPSATSVAAPPPSAVAAAAATEATRWLQRECEGAGGRAAASPWRRLPAHVRAIALGELRSAAGRGHLPPASSDLLFPRTTLCAGAVIHGAKALAWLTSGSAVPGGGEEAGAEAERVDEAEASAASVRATLLRAGIEAPLLALLRAVKGRAGRDETAACRQLCRLAANLQLSRTVDEHFVAEAWTAVFASCMLHGDAKVRAQAWRAVVNCGLDGGTRPQKYGDNLLPVLDAPDGEEAVPVDILLVHGLQGASLRTWRASGVEPAAWLAAHPSWLSGDAAPSTAASVPPSRVRAPTDLGVDVPQKDGSRAALWPVLWLARDVGRMRRGGEGPRFAPRVLAVSYDATLLAADCNRPHMELEVWAEVIARQLADAGVGAPGRRTLILAHSLGGILIKALACTEPGRLQLLPSTDAVVFFGVPHRGSHVAAAFLALSQAVDEAGRGGLRALASPHIGLLGSGEALAHLDRSFAAALGPGPAPVLSFGEELRTPITAALRVLVVPPHSADPGYGVYLTAPGTQHYDVCKPRAPDRGDALYEPLLAFVKRQLEGRRE